MSIKTNLPGIKVTSIIRENPRDLYSPITHLKTNKLKFSADQVMTFLEIGYHFYAYIDGKIVRIVKENKDGKSYLKPSYSK